MQPGYPNPHLPPQNPIQPMPPAPGSFPAPVSKPTPSQTPYTPSPQPPNPPNPAPAQPNFTPPPQPRPMNDIAPPQNYGYGSPQTPYTPSPQPPNPPNPAPAQPNFTPPPQPRPMNDIAPPLTSFNQPSYPQNPMQSTASPSNPFSAPRQDNQPAFQPARPQLVQDIPVRIAAPTSQTDQFNHQPYRPPQQRPQNPFNTPRPTGDPFGDNHMENILKDVNRNVAKPDSKTRKNPLAAVASKLGLNRLKTHTKKAVSQPKPMMIVGLAAATFISLALAAFFAFNNDGNARPVGPEVKVVGTTAAAGDSIQAGGGTLVSPQEVEDLSNNLENQINGFNESQDFGQDPLTDQALGL